MTHEHTKAKDIPLTEFDPKKFVALLDDAMIGQAKWNEEYPEKPETIYIAVASRATGGFYACYPIEDFIEWIEKMTT